MVEQVQLLLKATVPSKDKQTYEYGNIQVHVNSSLCLQRPNCLSPVNKPKAFKRIQASWRMEYSSSSRLNSRRPVYVAIAYSRGKQVSQEPKLSQETKLS